MDPFHNELVQILYRIENANKALIVFRDTGISTAPLSLRDELTSIQYALLRIKKTYNEPELHCICRQALLLYLATLLNGLLSTSSNLDTLGASIRLGLENDSAEGRKGVTQRLRLWIAVLIAIIVGDPASQLWARKELASIAVNSRFSNKTIVKDILRTFFWVDSIHGSRFDILWEQEKRTYQY